MASHPSVDRANAYALGVVSGTVLANKWIQLACKRHLDDLRASKQEGARFRFDPKLAEKACTFIQTLPHTKGKWASKRELLRLGDWQAFFVCSIFGWLRVSDGKRRFRQALLWVCRKNGKSALAAAIGLYMLVADGEYGAEVYSGATSEKQAWEVFRPAKIMAQKSPDLLEWFGVEVNASNICVIENGSRFEPVIGKPGDGSSPHLAIVDEYHEHKVDEMVDTMITGMGAREQPLLLMITTAGDNLAGPCYQMQIDAQKVLEGVIENDEIFALIYTADADDDWASQEAMKKANPNLGVSVFEDFLQARLTDAKNNARKQSTYKTKHLNIWVGSREAYFNVSKWRELGDPKLKLEDFAGKDCYLGLDLASKHDIAALEVLIPLGDSDYVEFGRYYLPEETVMDGANEHYQGWVNDGHLVMNEGEITNYRAIMADILWLSTMFNVIECAYDPYQATMLVTELMGEGIPMVEVKQTSLQLSEPMKHIDAMIRAGQIRHNGNPAMAWMMSNVVARTDANDNVFPRKDRSENKIDGPVALINAMSRAMVKRGNEIQQGFVLL